MSQKRKLWSQESMEAAVQSVQEGMGLREASRLYNVPIETLRRRVTGKVELDCRPGPPTVLTQEEEMADMGYGLTKEAVMYMVGAYVTKSNEATHLRMGRQVAGGFKDSKHGILTLQYVCHNLCLTLEHLIQLRKS